MSPALKSQPNDMPARAERVLTGYVTEGYLCRVFNRSPLTIALWRSNRQLPYVTIPGDGRDAIRYVLKDVLAWAKRNNVSTRNVEK